MAREAARSPGRLALHATAGAVVAFLLLPSLLVVVMSFGSEKYLEFPPRAWSLRWYAASFRDPDWIGPTLFSLRIAVLTAGVATATGTLAALGLVRGQLPGRAWLDALVVSPMVAPGIIVAIAMYLMFARLRLGGTTAGFVLARTVLAVPYVVLTVSAALARFDSSLELAALSLGAPRWAAVRGVTLPLVLPGVVTGAVGTMLTALSLLVMGGSS